MPNSALRNVDADHVVGLSGMAALLVKLTETPMKTKRKGKPGRDELETAGAAGQARNRTELDKIGQRSTMTCPECKGALWEIDEDRLLRFRCHIGHAYTAEGLIVDQEEEVELAMGHALRALEDRADLARRLAQRAKEKQQKHNEVLYRHQAVDAEAHAETLRKALLTFRPMSRTRSRKPVT